MVHALTRIDMASIVFFIGILLAVATLEDAHILETLAVLLDHAIGEQSIIVAIIGAVSSIIDNVPLVAASMGMYDIHQFGTDSFLWTFLAFCAGTGGSLLIIGSAAGVAAMGLEKINFFWYMKKISGLAILGYIAGILVFPASVQTVTQLIRSALFFLIRQVNKKTGKQKKLPGLIFFPGTRKKDL